MQKLEAVERPAEDEGTTKEQQLEHTDALREQRRLPEALAAAQKLLGAHPEFADGWNQLGRVHHAMGDWDLSLGRVSARGRSGAG